MYNKVWDKIIYPFPNCNGATVEVLEWDRWFHPTLYNGCNYLSMLGLKLNHVSKRGPRCPSTWHCKPSAGAVLSNFFNFCRLFMMSNSFSMKKQLLIIIMTMMMMVMVMMMMMKMAQQISWNFITLKLLNNIQDSLELLNLECQTYMYILTDIFTYMYFIHPGCLVGASEETS